MTCIAMLLDEGVVHAAYDSEMSGDGQSVIISTPKVAINGDYLIGACTSMRVINVLHHSSLPTPPTTNLERFMATQFATTIAGLLNESPGGSTDEKMDEDTDLLVAVHGRIFVYGDDYSVFEPQVAYTAVGSGFNAAMGSLFTSEGFDLTPKQRVTLAVQAAAYSSTGVREPARYVSL